MHSSMNCQTVHAHVTSILMDKWKFKPLCPPTQLQLPKRYPLSWLLTK